MRLAPNPPAANFFDREIAQRYDQRNRALGPISNCLHFLLRLTLSDIPADSSILCVGVGTGADIFALAELRPDLRFVGVDPSADMLEIARHRLEEACVLDRCELVQGYVEDVAEINFDVAISLFVAHFIHAGDRPAFYQAIFERLKPGGHFASAEISGDLESPQFPEMLADWRQVQAMMGATPESLDALEQTFRSTLGVTSPAETMRLWNEAGFSLPVPFFQAFMIHGWHARRPMELS